MCPLTFFVLFPSDFLLQITGRKTMQEGNDRLNRKRKILCVTEGLCLELKNAEETTRLHVKYLTIKTSIFRIVSFSFKSPSSYYN